MIAILPMLVFAAAAILAVSVVATSWQRHGAQAIGLLRAARAVPEMREFTVRLAAPASDRPLATWPALRRQPRRLVTRPAVRLVEVRRAAA